MKVNGMTLVELVIAIAIVAILLPFIISALANPLVDAVWGDQMAKAMALAQERIEEIYATKANSSASLGYSYLTAANYPDENPVSGFSAFTRTVAFQDVAGNDLSTAQSSSGYRKVTVTVGWDSGASSVVLTGLVTDY